MKQNIGSIFSKLFKKKVRTQVFFGQDPRKDWEKLVILFLTINLLTIGWSAYLFWQINQGDIFEVASAPTVGADAATRDNLKNILTIYDAKEKQFEALRLAKPTTIDPTF